MHISRIDLNLFVVFDTVLAEGGITAASRRLNLSQPAVSHALARLRELLGDPLFERQGRGMVPTPYARGIAGDVRQALARLEGTFREAGPFVPARSERRFAVAFRDVLELLLVPVLMGRLAAAGPGIELVAARMDRARLETDLQTGAVDLAIDVLLPVPPTVRRERILTEPMVVVAREGHPALRQGLDLAAYLAEEHIQVSSRRRGPGLEDMELARLGVSRRIRLRCRQYGTACRTASVTDLLATMPARYAEVVNRPYGNRVAPLPLPETRLELFLYWHANTDRDPASAWLREQLKAAIASA